MHNLPTTLTHNKPGKIGRVKAFGLTLALGCALNAGYAFATINNTATASGDYAATTFPSAPVTVNVSVTPNNPQMQVTKTASPTSNLNAGDVVTYTYVVKNSGNVTIKNISLADVHNASGPAPTPSSETLTSDVGIIGDSTDATPGNGIWDVLAPGDTITFTATYTVQQADVDQRQ